MYLKTENKKIKRNTDAKNNVANSKGVETMPKDELHNPNEKEVIHEGFSESRMNQSNKNDALETTTDYIQVPVQDAKKIKPNRKEKSHDINDSRRHIFSCLCATLNQKLSPNSLCSFFTKSLLAYPFYFCTFLFILVLAIIGIIIWLSYTNFMNSKVTNNSYFAKCQSNSDCNSLAGLGCSGENSVCKCPAAATKGRCDCSQGTYWDGTKCTPWLQYQQKGCSGDYSCDRTKELKCINQVCDCRPPKYWNSTSNTCDFVFLGCFIDGTNGGGGDLQSYNNYRRMYFFVDICLSFCRNQNTNMTVIFMSGGNNLCSCTMSVTRTSPTFCDLQCLGKNGNAYWCGNSNGNWQYRAVYIN